MIHKTVFLPKTRLQPVFQGSSAPIYTAGARLRRQRVLYKLKLSIKGDIVRNDGAKEARRVIKQFQEHINSPRLVPDQCYRMASSTYTLVCYVNQVTGLFLSKNYFVIPIFLQRAYDQLLKDNNERVSEPYRNLVTQYLSHIAHFLVSYDCLVGEVEAKESIPSALLDMLPEPLPSDLIVPGEF